MKITAIRFYDGAKERVCRLGLADLFLEVQDIVLSTRIELDEQPMANSAGVVRERIDEGFESRGGWILKKSGDVDWVKRMRYNQTVLARLGVEIQVSSRSDLLVRDLVHLRNQLQNGDIDVGIVVVPSDRMQAFLTDRTPSLREAIRIFENEFKEAQTYPIILLAVEHDGAGIALPKKTTNRGTGPKRRRRTSDSLEQADRLPDDPVEPPNE